MIVGIPIYNIVIIYFIGAARLVAVFFFFFERSSAPATDNGGASRDFVHAKKPTPLNVIKPCAPRQPRRTAAVGGGIDGVVDDVPSGRYYGPGYHNIIFIIIIVVVQRPSRSLTMTLSRVRSIYPPGKR